MQETKINTKFQAFMNIGTLFFILSIVTFFFKFWLAVLLMLSSFFIVNYSKKKFPEDFKNLTNAPNKQKKSPVNGCFETEPENKRIKVQHIAGVNLADANQKIFCSIISDSLLFVDESDNIMADVKYSDIKNLSIMEEIKQTQKNKSVVGRAIVGGLFLGAVGAIVGGISGACPSLKTDKRYYLEISLPENYFENILITTDNNTLKYLKKSIADKILKTREVA